jgi:replication factor C subunit 2/4
MNTGLDNSFVEKYAPKQLSEVVFADVDVEEAIQRYTSRQDMRPLILYGPNGTGKSTVARLLAKEILPGIGELNTLELDPFRSESELKTRKSIFYHISLRGFGGDSKILILDEFDQFQKPVVRSLKSAIEKYSQNVLFIATTNDLSALDKGHRSRAVCLQLLQAPIERWIPRIRTILDAERIPIPKDRLLGKMLENSGGDNRQFLEDLQRYVEEFKTVQTETV